MGGAETLYAKAGDVHIAYQAFGDGPVDIVIVWGTLSQVEVMWEEPQMARLFDRLSRFARVIHFDKRGTGLSDAVPGVPTLEERMEDVLAVMSACKSKRAFLFGESEGGPVSLLFAATHPDRTAGLVLFAPLVRTLWEETFPWGAPREMFDAWLEYMLGQWGTGQAALAFASEGETAVSPEWMAKFERRAMSPGALRQLMLANAEIDIRPVVPSVSVPALVLHYRGDPLIPIGQSQWLADHLADARLVELDGSTHWVAGSAIEQTIAEIEEFVTGRRPAVDVDRVLATVLFTDIVDSTGRVGELGDARWRELLRAHDAVVEREVTRHAGTLVKSTGDGVLATFDGPARAIRAAQAIVAGVPVDVRAGLHTGEIERHNTDVAGIAVHLAKRIESVAPAGGVLVSRTVRDLVAGSGIVFEDAGVHELKGIDEPWQLYRVEA